MLDRQRDEREASLPDAGPMRIALDGRRILLEQALAAWPRRGTTLVEINCGAGFLQQSLRADGFDVTGCEPSDFLRRRFAEVNGSHFTVEAGHSDLLPFDSESFDWGILASAFHHSRLTRVCASFCVLFPSASPSPSGTGPHWPAGLPPFPLTSLSILPGAFSAGLPGTGSEHSGPAVPSPVPSPHGGPQTPVSLPPGKNSGALSTGRSPCPPDSAVSSAWSSVRAFP